MLGGVASFGAAGVDEEDANVTSVCLPFSAVSPLASWLSVTGVDATEAGETCLRAASCHFLACGCNVFVPALLVVLPLPLLLCDRSVVIVPADFMLLDPAEGVTAETDVEPDGATPAVEEEEDPPPLVVVLAAAAAEDLRSFLPVEPDEFVVEEEVN